MSNESATATPWHLQGNYGPVQDELTRFDLPVTGAIPPELEGRYVRNGANPWYRNRYVRTPKLERDLEEMDSTTMMDPTTMMDRTASAANTHVVSGELETLGCETYDGRLSTAFSAHPKLCPETNELHFFGYGFLAPYLVYHVLDAQGRLARRAWS